MITLEQCLTAIKRYDGPPLKIMEVCGTHTHSIFQYGIRDILPDNLSLISGPGCPVCVTPAGYIDRAVRIAHGAGHTLCAFGDLMRVPGHGASLIEAKADGASVRMMYAPMDVLRWAQDEPDRMFYVAAVGFETTLPIYALLLHDIEEKKIANIRFLFSIKALLPALDWIFANDRSIGGLIGPGHVSAIIGSAAYEPFCRRCRVPLAIAGFSLEHLAAALYDLISQSRRQTFAVHNLYPNVVSRDGNVRAGELISGYFEKKPSVWRGLGVIDFSGYFPTARYAGLSDGGSLEDDLMPEPEGCLCGSIIIGRADPPDCPLFGTACTPLSPCGPCMVSQEGACGIWHRNHMTKRNGL